jgi:hypothetical protein
MCLGSKLCQGWPWTVIFLNSTSQIARITGVSHQCPLNMFFMIYFSNVLFHFHRG